MEKDKIIGGLVYIRDTLTTIPVTGVEDCQKIINSVVNVNTIIEELNRYFASKVEANNANTN